MVNRSWQIESGNACMGLRHFETYLAEDCGRYSEHVSGCPCCSVSSNGSHSPESCQILWLARGNRFLQSQWSQWSQWSKWRWQCWQCWQGKQQDECWEPDECWCIGLHAAVPGKTGSVAVVSPDLGRGQGTKAVWVTKQGTPDRRIDSNND